MQLAITLLGSNNTNYLKDVVKAIGQCNCSIIDLRSIHHADLTATYCLIEGNWNLVAKLENLLENLQTKPAIQIQMQRPETLKQNPEGLTYTLETISLFRIDVTEKITQFLAKHAIQVLEMNASRYIEPYSQNAVFTIRCTILIPPDIRLISLREEFLDFCEVLNLDAILEPIKR